MSDVTQIDSTPQLTGRLRNETQESESGDVWVNGSLQRATGNSEILLSQQGLSQLIEQYGPKAEFDLDILDDTASEGLSANVFHLEGHPVILPRTEGRRHVKIQSILEDAGQLRQVTLTETAKQDNPQTPAVHQSPAPQRVHMSVPLRLQGLDQLSMRGNATQQRSYVEVEGTAGQVPRQIAVDVSRLQPGTQLTVGELTVGSDMVIKTPSDDVIVSFS